MKEVTWLVGASGCVHVWQGRHNLDNVDTKVLQGKKLFIVGLDDSARFFDSLGLRGFLCDEWGNNEIYNEAWFGMWERFTFEVNQRTEDLEIFKNGKPILVLRHIDKHYSWIRAECNHKDFDSEKELTEWHDEQKRRLIGCHYMDYSAFGYSLEHDNHYIRLYYQINSSNT